MLTKLLLLLAAIALTVGDVLQIQGRNFKVFKDENELVQSKFWSELSLKSTKIVPDLLVYVNSTGSVYLTREESAGKNWSPWLKYRHYLHLQEVQYGDDEQVHRENIAISPCLVSSLSSENMSYTYTLGWDSSFDINFGPRARYTYDTSELGASITANVGLLKTSISNSGSIKCQPSQNGTVQVFGTMTLRYFPDAKQRECNYNVRKKRFEPKNWNKITTKANGREIDGAVFYDLSSMPVMECITKREYQQCNNVADLLDTEWNPSR
ncbi:predicted protein [Meyerozyma guilliermondii ATCC 6260]|uniref:Secreted protein n=1 Tax=Meyerozyma guilliermondii (strain ATCC 6260 / CBS 566 / DSM 6381 / JCM 1539 / NBRC 10279 / NRRL Y-324) TaxID=294746 RepID=A5DCW6_PICGU|nr:uncharacterized protein PGUG_01121 [Meyerozyma guilliermondii ATCC 6260]EDK37023.2 predicted protein [Meyerozyma guilliermondii ATCC 6260]